MRMRDLCDRQAVCDQFIEPPGMEERNRCGAHERAIPGTVLSTLLPDTLAGLAPRDPMGNQVQGLLHRPCHIFGAGHEPGDEALRDVGRFNPPARDNAACDAEGHVYVVRLLTRLQAQPTTNDVPVDSKALLNLGGTLNSTVAPTARPKRQPRKRSRSCSFMSATPRPLHDCGASVLPVVDPGPPTQSA